MHSRSASPAHGAREFAVRDRPTEVRENGEVRSLNIGFTSGGLWASPFQPGANRAPEANASRRVNGDIDRAFMCWANEPR